MDILIWNWIRIKFYVSAYLGVKTYLVWWDHNWWLFLIPLDQKYQSLLLERESVEYSQPLSLALQSWGFVVNLPLIRPIVQHTYFFEPKPKSVVVLQTLLFFGFCFAQTSANVLLVPEWKPKSSCSYELFKWLWVPFFWIERHTNISKASNKICLIILDLAI